MSSNSNTPSVNTAWRYQREHQPSSAITEYEKILKTNANDIDTLYGYALALRDNGQKEAAIENFQKALELVDSAANARRPPTNSDEEVRVASTKEDDRLMMLSRMIKQRLSELKA